MPYNVIILTSTIIALAFRSVYNVIVRRFVGAWEVRGRRVVARLKARVVACSGEGEDAGGAVTIEWG